MPFKSKKVVFFILLLFFFKVCYPQTTYGSEEEVKKQANKLFENEEFVKAYPLYSQLLSLYPNDLDYNYRFGVCMLFSVSDKEQAIGYIEKASKSPKIDPLLYYYLGRAYHLNYRFKEAITAYVNFKQKASPKLAAKLQVDRQIEMCNNGKKLLKNLTDIMVLDKKELKREDFFYSYKLDEFNSKLIKKPDDFKTNFDLKKKENSIMYIEQGKDVIYFSSYGEDGKNGKDIYVKKKLPNGEWSKPVNVGYPVNTEYDEDYPFLHPNGKILYFCSKGHNSMGGLDIFKSELNEETGTWTKPVNMDFAINTPDDDYMFVSDENDKIGYFASTRSSNGEMVIVYKIVIDRKPVDIAIVKGKILRNDGGTGLSAKITVKDIATGQVVGIFNSKEKNGDYLLNLPNGGNFMFTVKAEGYKEYSELVEIPTLYELKPLGQEIILSRIDGVEKIKIINKFSENISDEDYLNVMEFLKKKANLDVNYGQDSLVNEITQILNETGDNKSPTTVDNTKDNKNYTNEDLINLAYQDAKDAQKDANETRKDADNAKYISNQKTKELDQNNKDIEEQQKLVDNTTDPIIKQEEQKKLNEMKKQNELLNQQTLIVNNISDMLNKDAEKKQKDADFALKYAKDLERGLNNGNNEEAIKQLNDAKKILDEKNQQDKNTTDAFYADLKKKLDDKQIEILKYDVKIKDINDEIVKTKSEQERIKSEADKTKDPSLKQSLLDQVNEMEDEIKDKTEELTVVQKKSEKAKNDANNLKNQTEYTSDLINQINTGTYSSITSTNVDDNKYKPNTTTTTTGTSQQQTTKPPPLVLNNNEVLNSKYEKQLKDVELINDPYQKEIKKQEIYTNWSNDAKKEEDALKKKLASTTNQDDKKTIQEQLNKLNNTAVTSVNNANTSKKNADEIKKQQTDINNNTVVSNQNNTTTTTNNTSSEQNIVAFKESVKKTETSTQEINNSYQNKLTETENINDPILKEKKKEEVYREWADELKKQTDALQVSLDTMKSIGLNDKVFAQQEINKLKEQEKDINKKADNSAKKVDQLTTNNTSANNNVIADNTNTKSNKIEITEMKGGNYQKYYEDVLVDVDTISDNTLKQKTKSDIYEKWMKSIQYERDSLMNLEVKTKNKKKKAELQSLITQLDDEMKEKKKLADDALTTTDNIVVTNTIKTDSKTTDNVIVNDIVYQDNEAKKNFDNSKIIYNQSINEQRKADSLKQLASQTNNADKKLQLFTDANDAEKKSEQLMETYLNSLGDANKLEFTKNKKQINDLNTNTTTVTNDELLKADVLNDEAKALFAKAQQQRNEANNLTGEEKTNMLITSNNIELDAIKKQQESIKIYEKYATTSTVVVNNTNNTTSNVVNNTNTIINETPEYKKYEDMKREEQNLISDINAEYAKADNLKKLAQKKNEDSQQLIENTVTVTDENQKQKMLNDAEQLDNESLLLLRQSDSIKNIADQKQKLVIVKSKESDDYLSTLDANKSNDIVSSYKNANPNTTPTTNTIVSANTTSTNTSKTSNDVLTDKITVTNTSVYSNTKPIPIDKPLPEGLVFKVQIGAFRNPIAPETFKGISPLTGETTTTGLTRYMAGLFTKPDNALAARNQIRGMGYSDAFVVAFYNGKRITYEEAMKMINSGNVVSNTNINNVTTPENNIVKNNPSNTNTITNTNTTNSNSNTTPVTTIINDVKSTDVKSLSGLFYTVQVGVFSKKVTSAQLFGIQPLNSENIQNGLIRYTSGTFSNENAANLSKNKIVQLGVTDAFVVAYYNGKRITLEEAASIIADKGSSVFSNSNTTVNNTTPNNTTNTVTQNNTTTSQVTNQTNNSSTTNNTYVPVTNTANSDTGIVFKVQIGAFNNEVPIDIVNQFLKISKQGIKNFKDDNGLKIYTVGAFNSYEEAQVAKKRIVEQGITDAFVIAIKNGKKIDIKQLLGEQ